VDDPILQLTHDHRELTNLLVAVNAAVTRVERGSSKIEDELHEIRDGIEAFREALLEHFAREQEALVPFVGARVPSMRERSERITADHDQLAELLTAVLKDLSGVERSGSLASWRRSVARFEELYSAHTRTELAFLHDVERLLAADPDALNELRTLLDRT
jgi:hemerythrin-like domain-containing protein